jgi:PadR family transcriptional regulator, regulatory protein PadR
MTFNSDLVRGTVDTIVLTLLKERTMYGYEIIKEVNVRTHDAFAWKEGTLYPCLHRLEIAGLLAADWQDSPTGKPRKYYRLTRKGLAAAGEKAAEWQSFSAAMRAFMPA